MKKALFLAAAAIMSLGSAVFASTNASDAESASASAYSPQVCQFSLSHYRGTINSGSTARFTVGLSCPQEEDTYATVVVYIDGKIVASEVVQVPANSTKSAPTTVSVSGSYNGKGYELGVQ